MTAATNKAPPHTIHAFGLCVPPHCDHGQPDGAQVAICRAWIRRWGYPRKSFNVTRGSYALKHAVEGSTRASGVSHLQTDHLGRRWCGPYVYVTNGAFICAAVLEGYRMVACSVGSPNAFFNMGIRKAALPVVALEGVH